jgi:uncharacterized RDD family membrane protein YckC
MNWYYVRNGQQAGPVDEAQLDALQRAGEVQMDTLIWREGMANWQPYGEVRPGGPAPGPASDVGGAAPSISTEAPQSVCAECGKMFPVEDTIRYGNVRVCATCKPRFVQKLAEGAQVGGGMNYASIGTRFAAVFLDGILLFCVNTAMNLAAGLGAFRQSSNLGEPHLGMTFLLMGIQMGIGIAYETIMIGKYGATLGKLACKIRVVTGEGGTVSYGRAFGRYFAKLLSGLMCMVGYIMAFFDEEKRALHDRICNTRVVLR